MIVAEPFIIALDKSLREYSPDGHLHVELTNISKGCVNGYMGKEIPGWQSLGLDSERVYQMYRHPDELAKAAPTFDNLPLLSRHEPLSADKHPKGLVCGSTGTDCVFDGTYLKNSLVVWDNADIAGIETEQKYQLSAAYHYVPVMGAGVTADGVPYDGIMTEIVGNHVALVPRGRAGGDVCVADENPFKESKMKTKKELLADLLQPFLAADAAPDLDAILALAKDEKKEEPDGDEIKDGENEEEYKARMAMKKRKVASDNDDKDKDDKPTKAAMDEAISGAVATAKAQMREIQAAEKIVAPIVGEVFGMDSAEEVYKMALDQMKVDVSGVDPSAYGAMVRFAVSNQIKKPAVLAQDSGEASLFPDAPKLKGGF